MDYRTLRLSPPLQVALPSGEHVRLRAISAADANELRPGDLENSSGALTILRHQLNAEDAERFPVAMWSAEDISAALRQYSSYAFDRDLPGGCDVPEVRFFENYKNWCAELNNRAIESLTRLADSYSASTEKGINDKLRSFVSTQNRISSVAASIESILKPYAEISRTIEEITRPISEIQRALAPVKALQDQIAAYQRKIVKLDYVLPKPGKIFSALTRIPEWTEVVRKIDLWRKELDEGELTLKEAGFGFMLAVLSIRGVREAKTSTPGRSSIELTSQFLALTRSAKFADDLIKELSVSEYGRRRGKIVKQALAAHQRRHYCVSVPVLTAQLEGVLTDLLGLAGAYVRHGGQWVLKDGAKPKLNKSGKPETESLHNKLARNEAALSDRVKLMREAMLQDVFDSGMGRKKLSDSRNEVMHGQSVRYGTAKLSTQLVLALYVLSRELAEFERRKM
jgi:hypothetical protein